MTSGLEPVSAQARDRIETQEGLRGKAFTEFSRRVVAGNTLEETLGWIGDLVTRTRADELDTTSSRILISDLAWLDRSCGNAFDGLTAPRSDIEESSESFLELLVAYFVTQRLRFDFRFAALLAYIARTPGIEHDAQIQTMRVFALLGSGSLDARAAVTTLTASGDLDSVCRDILLHGLWFGTNIPEQADLILDCSDDILAHGESSPNVYFRRAFAFRRKGDLARAAKEIQIAIDLLGPGQNDVHQDYIRELDLIATTGLLRDQVRTAIDAQLEAALAELDSRASAAEETVSRSLIGVVEVLGLFVAIVGFLAASVGTLFTSQAIGAQITVIVLLFVGSIAFFVTLRFIVRVGSFRPRGRRRAANRDHE